MGRGIDQVRGYADPHAALETPTCARPAVSRRPSSSTPSATSETLSAVAQISAVELWTSHHSTYLPPTDYDSCDAKKYVHG